MSQYAIAKNITLDQIIKQATSDVADRVEAGETPSASYFIEDGGVKFVLTVTPADQITHISAGRRSVQ